MTAAFTHGQEVMVLDARGNYECRGRVMGVHRCNPTIYDVQPLESDRLAARKIGIPERQVQAVPAPILAYERRDDQPKHIKDEA
ncbi:hypothetical protein J8F10_09100 [Gemmata sp. G18]|uniref:Uncharacterized protein n=1 Tax=Gemmata palustris TaxID=2822762 RepID=A0ABS5BPR4_9BACT|nr:hypothetical protein [Gemmata palustris]MBP3955437.1 hypothetical protein [Gemmata palustris]